VPYAVEVTPDGGTVTKPTSTAVNSVSFTVRNAGDNPDTYGFSCFATGPLTCTGTPSPVTLQPFTQTNVTVQFSTSGTIGSGTLQLEASGGTVANDVGSYTVTTAAAPTVTFVVPTLTSGSRAVVRTRQPIIRALFASGGSGVDSMPTMTWRGQSVTALVRRSRGLIEWEVDSTRWLGIGDSAQVAVTACAQVSACTTVSRWVVLENDQKPVLGFSGIPLEALGSQFTAPFGPGISVSGAEVESGFSTTPYYSMGVPRSVGLSYSTRQSYPRALVPVDLELPWPAGTPNQVKLVLIDGGTRLDSLVLSSPTCATGAVKRCRTVLQADFSGGTYATPTRKWLTVEVSVTSGATTKMGSDSVEVVVVDRRDSPYGNGWWPSVALQLAAAGTNDRVLVGPTGAATVFRGNGDSVYISPPGNFSTLRRIAGGEWELQARGTTAKLVFDSSGRLKKSVDRNGNRDSLAYNASSKLTSVTDPVGKTTTLAYSGGGKLVSMTDPGGRVNVVTINGSNKLVYDSLASGPSAGGGRYVNSYTYRDYGSSLVLWKRIGVLLDTTIVRYDSTFRRRPYEVRLPRVQDETGNEVTPVIEYFAYERQGYGTLRSLDSVYVELKDPRDNWTRSLLNRWGQSRRTWDAIGVLSRSQYDPDGLIQWSEGKVADSSRVYQAYDSFDRLAKSYIIRAAGDTLRLDSLVYDGLHRMIKRIDSRGKRVDSLSYDANGNVIASTDVLGNTSRTWYASDGLPDSTRAAGNTVSRVFTYHATTRNLQRVLDETGDTVTTNSYDTHGRLTKAERRLQVEENGTGVNQVQWRRTQTYYNSGNQVDSVVVQRTNNCTSPCSNPVWPADTLTSQRVGYRYDRAGRDSLRLNERGVATRYVYDLLGRLTSRRPWTDSSTVKDSMVYDVAGNLVKTITRRGDVILIARDSRNRATGTIIPGVGTLTPVYGGPLDQVTRLYFASPVDSIGGVSGELRWGYDQRGRLKADTSYTGTTARSTTYAYDSFERPSTMTDPLGTWTTRYEAQRGYADTLLTPFADTLLYTYDAQGRSLGPTIGSSGPRQARSMTWLENGELSTLTTTVSTGTSYVAGKYERQMDLPDDPVPLNPIWTEKQGSTGPTVVKVDGVDYDGWQRVKRWTGTTNGGSQVVEAVEYDRTGNLKTADNEEYDLVTDRLLQRTAGGHRYFYTYDRAGNLTQERDSTLSSGTVVVTTYAYDGLSQLRSVRRGATLIARYGYDVQGRRIAKRVYSAASGGAVGFSRFVYHGGHVAFETDSVGTIGLRYTWGQDVDDLIGVRDAAGNQYYAVQDKLGSVRGLVKRDGTWVLSLAYKPWGGVLDSAGTQHALLRYRWTGREYDVETGFYFHRSRYYSPAARRFVQEDPIGNEGSTNLYAYVDGEVLEATDPSGLFKKCPRCGGGGGSPRPDGGYMNRFDGMNSRFGGWDTMWGPTATEQMLAEYEAWVAAGSYVTASGKRALTTPEVKRGYDPDPTPGFSGLLAAANISTTDLSIPAGARVIAGVVSSLKDLPKDPNGTFTQIPFAVEGVMGAGLWGRAYRRNEFGIDTGNEYVMPRAIFDVWYAQNQPAFAAFTVYPIRIGGTALTAIFVGYLIYPYYNELLGPEI
jgi:RHS repeat-associated protein